MSERYYVVSLPDARGRWTEAFRSADLAEAEQVYENTLEAARGSRARLAAVEVLRASEAAPAAAG